jgi:membrane-associated phospholipid phosphatase
VRARNKRVISVAASVVMMVARCLAQNADPDLFGDSLEQQPGISASVQDPSPENPQADSAAPKKELPNPFRDSRDRIFYPGDTERIKPLGIKLISNILLDQKEIWTSPFHMNKQDAKWWVLFGGGTAALIATDHRTINTFENSSGQVSWGNGVSNIGASYTLIPLVVGFYGYGAIRDNAQARETGVLGAEALLDSLVVVTALKYAAGRVRPDSANGERGQFFDGGDSFPSGHAIESWALASLISHEYKRHGGKWVPYVSYGLATVVSAARFSAQRHYASDILAGAGLGWFIGRYVYQTHEDHAAHTRTWMKPLVVPGVDPITKTYSVALRFGNSGL